jgi:hypothetical protein
MQRTAKDDEILTTLACKVRFLTADMVADAFWAGPGALTAARRRLTKLCDAGYAERFHVLCEPLLDLPGPLVVWAPDEPDPDCGAVAWELQNRWPQIAQQRTVIYRASQATNNQYGGSARPKPIHPDQVSHDLHVGLIYLRFLRLDPEAAEAWVGEDLRPKAGYHLADPDALVEYTNGRASVAIEFGGKYDARRVREFHEDCLSRGRAYQLW